MGHSRAQPLRGRLFQISQHSIHTARVDTWVPFRNPMRALPALFVLDQPGSLLGCE